MIKFTDKAIEKVKFFLQNANEQDMALRISITERNKDGFQYHFGLESSKNEKNDDVMVREGGFITRIDASILKWIKDSTVDWISKDFKEGFSVVNPNPPISSDSDEELKESIIHELKTIFDPEIPVNIYDLGLIYNIDIHADQSVDLTMTLTAPNCPVAESLPVDVKNKVEKVPGVSKANVTITWEPVWTTANMSEAAKLELNIST
jgi:FeS assembly SUF system protein